MSQQINLFNPIYKQQKKYLSAVAMAQALGLILLGALLVSAYAGYRLTALQSQAASVSNRLNAEQERLVKVNAEYASRQKDRGLELKMQKAETELGSLKKVADILQQGELGNTQGYADYLRAFARKIVPGVWLTNLRIQGAGAEISLQGRALNPELIPIYIGNLKSEPVMQGKSFAMLEMQVPRPVVGAQSGTAIQPASATHIEFNLRSSGMIGQAGNAAGVPGK